MNGQRCAFAYAHPSMGLDGKCGRFAAPGEKLCAVHDPERKAKTAAARVVRRRRETIRAPSLSSLYRDHLIHEIAELAFWWDGPGSEGRCV